VNLTRSLRRRATAIYILLGILVVAGVISGIHLPSAIFPSVTFPIVKIIADVGEEPSQVMIPTVTRPLEEAVRRVPGVDQVRSTTSRGSCEISVEFEWGTDMVVAIQRVQAETDRIRPDLPAETRIDVQWMNTAIFPIQGYAITSESRTPADLRQLAEYTLKSALLRIPGVSEVQIQGGRRSEFQVRLDPAALQGWGLSVSDVVEAIRRNHQVLPAGLTERNHELYLALVDGRVHAVDSLAAMEIAVPDGPPVRLGDLGRVQVADQISYVLTTANGKPAVLLNIIQQPSANTLSIAKGIDTLIRERKDLLPPDVQWSSFYDQARFVSASVNGTREAILIGAALAALVLLVFLGHLRPTLIAAATIPVTAALVALALRIFGQTVNLMTLSGLAAAIGLIADDAIVVIENVVHHHRPGAGPDATERGVREILPALVGSTLATTVILVPFVLLAGVVGAFFKPLALTMAAALVASLLVAVFVLPPLMSLLDFGPPRPGPWAALRRRLVERPRRAADALVRLCLRRGWVPAAALVLLLGAGFFLYTRIGSDFLPRMDEGSIILDYWTPPGTSLTDTDAILREAERVILSVPDVSGYSRRTGTQLGFFITEPNSGDYVINLKPRRQRRPVEEVMDDLRERLAAVEPALRADFGQLIEDDIGDLTGGVPQPIEIRIYGEDQSILKEKARQIAGIVSSVPGTDDVFDGIVVAGPRLDIRMKSGAAARYHLSTEDVHAALEPAISGTVVDRIGIGERMYDLRVFVQHQGRLEDLEVQAGSGRSALLPIGTLATVETGTPETEIQRDDLRSYFGVTARISGRDLGTTMREIRARIKREVRLAPGMAVEYGGLYGQQQQSFRSLFYVLLAGLVLVSVIVLFEFRVWQAPVATVFSAMGVLAGVLGALILVHKTLNISSFVGAIMMVGIVGENAIFVIHQARIELQREVPVAEAWRRASWRRLRPVAMTILATAFALAPLALALGEGSQLTQPLAIGVIGGFALSGPIVLLLLPGLFRALDPRGRLGGR